MTASSTANFNQQYDNPPVPASGRGERCWSGREKLAMEVETVVMDEAERAACCRKCGACTAPGY